MATGQDVAKLEATRLAFAQYMRERRRINPIIFLYTEQKIAVGTQLARFQAEQMTMTLDVLDEFVEQQGTGKKRLLRRLAMQAGLLLLAGRCGKLTPEQLLMLNKQLGPGNLIKIKAVAKDMVQSFRAYVGLYRTEKL
jgi:hypothetical protein